MKQFRGNLSNRGPAFDVDVSNERGFVLIVAMLALCLLSLMGIWALSTADFEYRIASNLQTKESNFNLAEGAAKRQSAAVGFARNDSNQWYQITDPETFNQFLLPPTASYDPGVDMTIAGSFPTDFDVSDYETWPRQNLLQDNSDDQHDYAYLVTYLYPDNPPKGYDATMFSGYKFRISAHQKAFVEVGGIKVGVKAGS